MSLSNVFRGHVLSLLTALLLSSPVAAVNTSPQTLASWDAYTQMEPCATSCFYHYEGACSDDLVGSVLQCGVNCISWAPNDCYCRTDYQSIATSYLYTCVSKGCTLGDNSGDITSATDLYNSYCTSLSFFAPTQPPITAQPTTVYVTTTVTSEAVHTAAGRPLSWAIGILVV
jgi:hypothetical protein